MNFPHHHGEEADNNTKDAHGIDSRFHVFMILDVEGVWIYHG